MGDLVAVVLDVDGTLVDSERDGHRVAFNLAFEELGLPDRWDVGVYGDLLEITGGRQRLHDWLARRGMPEDERRKLVPRLHERKTELFQALVEEGRVEARPGAAELLDELEAQRVRLAVATTGTRTWVEPLLDRLFGLHRFEVVVAGDDVPRRKPDPAAHLLALEKLGLGPDEAVAVEDSRPGLVAAKAAGLPCVVVTNDYTHEQDLAEADLVLDGFGPPGPPAAVVSDPHGAGPRGRLDVRTLQHLLSASS